MTVWLPRYKSSWLRGDLIAGVAIWAVTVPQALAYAGIAGVPAVYGLYAVPLAMIGYAIFGTSRTLSVGPDSATAALSAAAIGSLVAQGSDDYIALTAALALMVGSFFLIAGLLRLGWVANFMANPVMAGFIQGLALVVMVGQLPKLFGVEGGDGNFFQQLWAIIRQLPEANPATIVVGFASLATLFALKRFAPKVPGALVTVILAILVTSVFNLTEAGVDVVGTVEAASFWSVTPSR
jgi:MFS superfamily sulfate permease-like transporter